MRIFGLVLGLCLITSLVFAGAEGEVISIDKDDNGNIRVWTQYKIDGIEVGSRYPKIDGKAVYCSRYHAINFLGMTDAKIKERILQDVNAHTKSLIKNTYIKEANKSIYAGHLGNIAGSKISNQTTTEIIDDKKYTFKTDGTYTVKSVSP